MTDRFDQVDEQFGELRYMCHPEAKLLRDVIIKHGARELLEIGFFHGKSSAYFAAILEDLGEGRLVTIDIEHSRRRTPNIHEVLSALDLEHRVSPVFAERSYTWELGKMIRAVPRPQFDFCYFDGGHTWDDTGFGFLLVDMLLKPGGVIVFDDLTWSMEKAIPQMTRVPRQWRAYSQDEQSTPAVQMVFDLLLPHLGYTGRRTLNRGRWGMARKPPARAARTGHSSVVRNLFQRLGSR